jgi:hypothetical protein
MRGAFAGRYRHRIFHRQAKAIGIKDADFVQ